MNAMTSFNFKSSQFMQSHIKRVVQKLTSRKDSKSPTEKSLSGILVLNYIIDNEVYSMPFASAGASPRPTMRNYIILALFFDYVSFLLFVRKDKFLAEKVVCHDLDKRIYA